MSKDNKQLKIVLAVPALPPQIGGPAVYACKLAQELRQHSAGAICAESVCYSRGPKIIRHFVYSFKLFGKALGADMVYAFNTVSCGLPACIVSFVLRKKFVIRIGGDYLWERAVERGKTNSPLRDYYQKLQAEKEPSAGEKFWLFLQKQVLKNADKLIFTTDFQKQLYQNIFGFAPEKAVVIANPFPQTSQTSQAPFHILYAGRLLKLKNISMLINVFARGVQKTDKPITLKIIGQGPELKNLREQAEKLGIGNKVIFQASLPRQELFKEINSSYLCILPSLTEISPNFALECIALNKPILLTRETGIYEQFKDKLIFIEPQNQNDLEKKIRMLLETENYQNYVEKIKSIDKSYSWTQVAQRHILLFNELTKYQPTHYENKNA